MAGFMPWIIPTWAKTVGNMQAEGKPEDVKAYCPRCQQYAPVDLDKLVREKGPDYSLVNRRPRCSIMPGCDGRVSFHVRHGVFRVLREG